MVAHIFVNDKSMLRCPLEHEIEQTLYAVDYISWCIIKKKYCVHLPTIFKINYTIIKLKQHRHKTTYRQ